ncbi:MAG: hypothetical protein RML45_12410 [Acetobacteraceae bacterium]|nr:hypothetical protein [Acetobacteraceae bacterium]
MQRFGATRVFCAVVALLGNAQMPPTLLPVATVMLPAQHCAVLAATIIVPALVAIIATYNPTQQQATAVGALGSMRAGGGVIALLIGSICDTSFAGISYPAC